MLGQHPSQDSLLRQIPPGGVVRTADSPPVPAEEARAYLYAGNKRYSSGTGGSLVTMDESLMRKLSEGGQNPVSIILGCADSRAPIEILFDVRPGDLFVLRNAGNTCASASGSLVGSAEYAIGNLNTKLLAVTGHTKCGAVTAAVQTAVAQGDTATIAGSIGKVLDDIIDCAKEAITILPEAPLEEQVTLATKLNVFATMRKLIDYSPIVKEKVVTGDLQLIGCVYDIFTGEVEWLGEHPELEAIVGHELPYHKFKNTKYYSQVDKPASSDSPKVEAVMQRLQRGNQRFMDGACTAAMGSYKASDPVAPEDGTLSPIVGGGEVRVQGGKSKKRNLGRSRDQATTPRTRSYEVPDPFALIIGGGEVRVPIETIFDVKPGDLVVQRVMGNIAGRTGGTLMNSVEFAVTRYDLKLLVVMGDGSSRIVC
jgi:carbonic anhydrase